MPVITTLSEGVLHLVCMLFSLVAMILFPASCSVGNKIGQDYHKEFLVALVCQILQVCRLLIIRMLEFANVI